MMKNMKDELEWSFAAFGTSTTDDPERNGFRGSAGEGSVRVYCLGGSGKLVPNSMDGLSFYYTKIKAGKNFTIKARAHINSWSFTNGQEAFGVMAADRIGETGARDFWNNSVMSVVSKHFYGWDRQRECFSEDPAADRISMFIGVSGLARFGVDGDNLGEFESDSSAAVGKYFTRIQSPLEHFCAGFGSGFYNIAAGYTPVHLFDVSKFGQEDYGEGTLISQAQGSTPKELLREDFILSVSQDNSGCRAVYYDEDGSVIGEKTFFDPRYYDEKGDIRPEPKGAPMLERLDEDWVYVGFFAARNADVTFDDITVEIRERDEDPATAEHERVFFENRSYFASADHSGTQDYDIAYLPSWNGHLKISDDKGNCVFDGEVFADKYLYAGTVLSPGMNEFTAEFTPDEGFHYGYDESHPEAVYNVLRTYDTLVQKLRVEYREISMDIVHVSPEGRRDNTGAADSPLDIYTAVAFAHPGQSIYLKAGLYEMDRPLKLERGVDGRADAPIRLMREPAGYAGAAVLDFSNSSDEFRNWTGSFAGLCVEAKHWHIENIEVRNTLDIQVGVRISGVYCVLKNVTAHHCGNAGICILARSYDDHRGDTDAQGDILWPNHNLIKSCVSYENTDRGHDLADGFGCKILAGEGNVFENCISHHNSDDGFDFYTKAEWGGIGKVVLKNCIAYMNGYIHEDGELIDGGNGNGFKLGGEGIKGGHELYGCVAYDNKGEGFDSNSCPDIRLFDCIAYDNKLSNIHLYGRKGRDTDILVKGANSFRTGEGLEDMLETGPNQTPEEAALNCRLVTGE